MDWLTGTAEWTDVSGQDGYDHFVAVWWDCEERYGSNGHEYCIGEFPPGTGWTKQQGNAKTYSANVSGFGVSLTYRSGHSAYVRQEWKFGNQPFTHYVFANTSPEVSPVIWSY